MSPPQSISPGSSQNQQIGGLLRLWLFQQKRIDIIFYCDKKAEGEVRLEPWSVVLERRSRLSWLASPQPCWI